MESSEKLTKGNKKEANRLEKLRIWNEEIQKAIDYTALQRAKRRKTNGAEQPT